MTATFGDRSAGVESFGDGTPAVDRLGSSAGAVTITTTGYQLQPEVELAPGSSDVVTWLDDSGATLATGTTPTINFGVSAVRTVRMMCTDNAAVRSLNLGFDHTQDAGKEGPGSAYDKPPQAISGISGLGALNGLTQFMAAQTQLTGTLDLTGCAALKYVECFGAQVSEVTLTGCTSLVRLCFEANHLAYLDLNPVRGNLYDLRAAIQFGGGSSHTLSFATLDGPMAHLWHYCVRDQNVANIVPHSQLPVVEQYWVWNAGQTTSDTPTSGVLTSMDAHGNIYDQASVNRILTGLNDSMPTVHGGAASMGGPSPTGAGATAFTALASRGWAIDTGSN